ncbi:MAG TPA: GNAT family N-acetyltransferase [Stackebrandtia sp.]|uniref:GNAT family N-acetyltransferase n=1 Tax=Stackebrandtia sp. TaxID=2023065 RepID=UPI002D58C2BA|nr:GNAT family N-acetyltransferase [Stackebrandtia sp.]HZE39786.1 GNAT family N-acetyltransferase [Stackebrandtia sp.]
MTDFTVRPAESDRDAADIAAVMTEVFPYLVNDAESVAYRMRSTPESQRPLDLIAEADGRVVGHGHVVLEPDFGDAAARFLVFVGRAHQGRGVGSALYQPMLEHARAIGAVKLVGRVCETAAFDVAARHGFAETRSERISHLSLDRAPAAVDPPEGIRVAALSDMEDFRALYDIDCAIIGDVPADEPLVNPPYEEWVAKFAADPRMNAECTVLALDGDTPVAVSWLDGHASRVWSSMTGVRREYRGRGLAKLVKTQALTRARDRGVTDAYTNNDSTNAGMLAVNDWLGYAFHAEQRVMVRVLD